MKEAVTKVMDTLTLEDFDGVFQKLLERYNKCIAAGRDYFEGDLSFMCVLSIKVPIRKSLETYRMHLVLILFAPSSLCVWNQMLWKTSQKIVLLQDLCTYSFDVSVKSQNQKLWIDFFKNCFDFFQRIFSISDRILLRKVAL